MVHHHLPPIDVRIIHRRRRTPILWTKNHIIIIVMIVTIQRLVILPEEEPHLHGEVEEDRRRLIIWLQRHCRHRRRYPYHPDVLLQQQLQPPRNEPLVAAVHLLPARQQRLAPLVLVNAVTVLPPSGTAMLLPQVVVVMVAFLHDPRLRPCIIDPPVVNDPFHHHHHRIIIITARRLVVVFVD